MNKIRFGDSKRPGFSFIILEEPFDDVRKEMVVQEARCFNDNNLNVRNCLGIISKLIYLINQGEKFLPSEIETLFFDSTKLLQTNDIELRRMVYFILRVLNEKQNYSFVVTSMLMNDINKNNDMYRANSFRMLGQIINSNDNINLLERYLKNV